MSTPLPAAFLFFRGTQEKNETGRAGPVGSPSLATALAGLGFRRMFAMIGNDDKSSSRTLGAGL